MQVRTDAGAAAARRSASILNRELAVRERSMCRKHATPYAVQKMRGVHSA